MLRALGFALLLVMSAAVPAAANGGRPGENSGIAAPEGAATPRSEPVVQELPTSLQLIAGLQSPLRGTSLAGAGRELVALTPPLALRARERGESGGARPAMGERGQVRPAGAGDGASVVCSRPSPPRGGGPVAPPRRGGIRRLRQSRLPAACSLAVLIARAVRAAFRGPPPLPGLGRRRWRPPPRLPGGRTSRTHHPLFSRDCGTRRRGSSGVGSSGRLR
jgi:hypothetical protein